jgi:hypothetical protein
MTRQAKLPLRAPVSAFVEIAASERFMSSVENFVFSSL